MEQVQEFVKFGLPPEYPFYTVIVTHVNFYVLVSDELTSEEIRGIARDFGNPSETWKRLQIWSGPHATVQELERSMEEFRTSGASEANAREANAREANAREANGGTVRGVSTASMTDEDAAKLRRVKRSLQ